MTENESQAIEDLIDSEQVQEETSQNGGMNLEGVGGLEESAESGGKQDTVQQVSEILLRETGPGEISEYIEHPLNVNQSEGLAQIIRGFTGFAGQDLKLAILDIGIGAYRLMK